jgi:hypothetical protein
LAEDVRELTVSNGEESIGERVEIRWDIGHGPPMRTRGRQKALDQARQVHARNQYIDSERYPANDGHQGRGQLFDTQPRLAAVENRAGRSHGRAARASMQPFLRSKILLILKICHALKV